VNVGYVLSVFSVEKPSEQTHTRPDAAADPMAQSYMGRIVSTVQRFV